MKASVPEPVAAPSGIWADFERIAPDELDRMDMGVRIRLLQGANPSQGPKLRRRRLRHVTEERGSSAVSGPTRTSFQFPPPSSRSPAWVAQADW